MTDKDISTITGLPSELGIDQALDKERAELTVDRDTRRYGKPVTLISGFSDDSIDLNALAKELKRGLATGGSVKDATIELQGEHSDRVRELLEAKGFQVA